MAQSPPDSTLQQRADFLVSGPPARAAPATTTDEAALKAAAPAGRRIFSAFVDEDLRDAVDLASRAIRAARGQGVEAGLGVLEGEVGNGAPGLVAYATRLFMTHHPESRRELRLLPLEKREGQLVVPSSTPEEGGGFLAKLLDSATPGATPPEDQLQVWREDPLLNEHHEHWHLVYPAVGSDEVPFGNRHGELFAYMHQQMLARYDAERLSRGLPRVEAFDDFAAPIPQGYSPGDLQMWADGSWYRFSSRPAGARLRDLTGRFATRPGARLEDQARFGRALADAARSGHYASGEAVNLDSLGNTVEANPETRDKDPKRGTYGNFHNDGHIHFMVFDNQTTIGAMGTTSAAVRDPIFWRWHKKVDSIFRAWQDQQQPHALATPSPVQVRDIILCREDSFPRVYREGDTAVPFLPRLEDEAFGQAIGQKLFGHDAAAKEDPWGGDFDQGRATLDGSGEVATVGTLYTEMRKRVVELRDDEGAPVDQVIDFLSHPDFFYFVRVENGAVAQDVAVRVFLAPEELVDDRTAWIEMDRFKYSLQANERAVIYRPSYLSSVVRKPVLRPIDLTPGDQPSAAQDQQAWCDCGWPYTLLLPRGTAEGMRFRLLVICSDGAELAAPKQKGKCSSISYCGLEREDYPDRWMGYPFDRPLAGSVTEAIAALPNASWRTVTIRCRNLR